MSKRKKINPSIEKILWAITAGRCEKCGRLIYQHPLSKTIGNFAQIAHNLPVGDKGPRSEYKKIEENGDINDINNLLLLCYDCHKEIDEIHPEKFPPTLLRQIKNDFEEFIIKATNIERIIPTLAIKYSPNLHGQQLIISEIQKAIFPDKAIKTEVDLTLKNSTFFDNELMFWTIEEKNLIESFNHKITPLIEDYQNGYLNISVFAIGPIPLLIKLGELLSNKQSVDVYQLKKSPVSSWEWETVEDDTEYIINYLHKSDNPHRIIMILSISGQVNYDDVKQTVAWDDSIVVEIKTNQKRPYDDFLRNKKQLEKFVKCYQQLKEELRTIGGTGNHIHVFAAVPVSVAVEIGRHRNKNVDLPMIIYNLTDHKYTNALTIGKEDE